MARIKLIPEVRQIRILYVEDEEAIRNSIEKVLRRRTHTLYVASNGAEGVALYKQHQPDMIITDIKMPTMTGLEMIRLIREFDENVKFIVTTAFGDSVYFMDAIELHANGYLRKPVDMNKLFERINELSLSILYSRQEKQMYRSLELVLNSQKNIVLLTAPQEIKLVNSAFLEFFGVSCKEEFLQKHTSLLSLFEKDDVFFHSEKVQKNSSWFESFLKLDPKKQVVCLRDKHNFATVFQVHITNTLEQDLFVISLTDITETKMDAIRHEFQATHDGLTGIFNRSYFQESTLQEIESTKRQHLPLSLIIFDIDNFKQINDTHGHLVGDKVLCTLTECISEKIRKSDVFARWGGEEFVVLLRNSTAKNAQALAQSLCQNIAAIHQEGLPRFTCSFGVTTLCKADTYDMLLEKADIALYEAKKSGKNQVVANAECKQYY